MTVSDALIARAILAGTVGEAAPAGTCHRPGSGTPPKPAHAERRLRQAAEATGEGAPVMPPLPAVENGPLHGLGIGALQAAFAAGTTDPVALLASASGAHRPPSLGRDAVLAPVRPGRATRPRRAPGGSGPGRPVPSTASRSASRTSSTAPARR